MLDALSAASTSDVTTAIRSEVQTEGEYVVFLTKNKRIYDLEAVSK
jgi:hypothetical protein